MSESAKKKLKQMRLPFAILDESEKTPKTSQDNSSSKAIVSSRKRKPSSDADAGNSKSTKIGRVAESKENISSKADVEILDSDDESSPETKDTTGDQALINPSNGTETTPTTTAPESVFHIKLPSCTKSKRKINMDMKLKNPIDEEDLDDSVVYLDDEDIPKSSKKFKRSVKKSEKKKEKKESSGKDSRVRKTLDMSGSVEDKVEELGVANVSSSEKASDGLQSKRNVEKSDADPMDIEMIEPDVEDEVASKEEKHLPSGRTDVIETIPSNASSPQPEDPDLIHEEIAEVLSDDSDNRVESGTFAKVDSKSLTPKQLAHRQKQEAQRLEKELQRKKERELKELQRLKEKLQREDAKRKEKEEKEEARKREKEERDRKRQAEQDKKDEEKRQKEEERKRAADQREEEKRQKEEERKRQLEMREEEKRKRDEAQKKKEAEDESRKRRAAEAFSKFFVPKKKIEQTTLADVETSKDIAEVGESSGAVKSNFMQFQVRERMKVAPCVRLQINKDQLEVLDGSLKTAKPLNELYLNELKSGLHKPGFSTNTWPTADKDEDDDVILTDELEGVGEDIQTDESEKKTKLRTKYLMFDENRRPAYHGTWSKKSSNITARRPLAQDQKFFDYEVESDDEWEEEEPGESLHGSDSEKEKEVEEEDYEVDNDFFVPHGHLSDEEMQQVDDEIEDNHPEAQKAKLKILQQEFAAEMKKKTEKIKPRLIGCIWMNGDEDENGCSKIGSTKKYLCSDIIWRILKAREMLMSEDGVKLEENLDPIVPELEEEAEKASVPSKGQVRVKFNEGGVKELMRLVHGNTNSRRFIVKEFQAYRLKNYHKDPDFQEFSVKSVDEKMIEISDYKTCAEEGPLFSRKCWLVKPDALLEHYGEEKLPLPNQWTYILEKEVKEKKQKQPIDAKKEEMSDKVTSESQQKPAEQKPAQVEKMQRPPTAMKAQPLEPNLVSIKKPQTPPANVVKKRVQLLSVPRGQEFPQSKKNNLMSQYLKGKEEEAAGSQSSVDDVIIID